MKDIHITRIVTKGFIGFSTTDIVRADIEFVLPLQIFNSSNASGKTTYMGEASISPINKSLYEIGGGKTVYFTVEGKEYIFDGGHVQNVLSDGNGKVLTQGTTMTHYLELVKSLFDYTDYEWRLVTGSIMFSKLNRSDRQKWIETISGIDFSYAFKIYSKIKSSISGVKRAIKEYDNELANTNEGVLKDDVRISTQTRIDVLNETLTKIIEVKGPTPALSEVKLAIKTWLEVDERLGKMKKKFITTEPKIFHHLNVSSLDEFRASYLEDTFALDAIDLEFAQATKSLRDKTDLRNTLSLKDDFDSVKATKHLAEVEAELKEATDLVGSSYADLSIRELETTVNTTDDIISQFSLEVMGNITTDVKYNKTKEVRTHTKNELTNLNIELRQVKEAIIQWNGLIEALNSSTDITCPECKTVFKDSEVSLSDLTQQLGDYENRLAILEARIEVLVVEHDHILDIESNLSTVTYIIRHCIPIRDMQNDLRKLLDGEHTLSDVSSALKDILGKALNRYKVLTLTKEAIALRDNLAYYKGLAKLGTASDYSNQCDAIEEELILIRNRRIKLNDRIKVKERDGKDLRRYIDYLDTLEAVIVEHGKALKHLNAVLYSTAVSKVLKDIQVEVGRLTTTLTNDIITMGIRNKLLAIVRSTRSRLSTLADIELGMNPSTGIIADQLIEYCRIFSALVTQILSRVWGYDLQVLEPIVHETRGINYRFPMSMKGKAPISDISLGSKSMGNIINLAILMASRELLQADGQLLKLDEVGEGFDAIHNINLGEFLYELIRDSKSKNIFVIHHDQTVRSSLGLCDTICFDPTQVVIDEGYNKHVKLTFKG